MRSLYNDRDRTNITERVGRLAEDAPPRWGRMNAAQMLSHLVQAMRMGTGEMPTRHKKIPMQSLIRFAVIYLFPMPRNAPTAPELMLRTGQPFAGEKEEFDAQLAHFLSLPTDGVWPPHPAFGPMTARQWGILGYKHCDHHLRQFGV